MLRLSFLYPGSDGRMWSESWNGARSRLSCVGGKKTVSFFKSKFISIFCILLLFLTSRLSVDHINYVAQLVISISSDMIEGVQLFLSSPHIFSQIELKREEILFARLTLTGSALRNNSECWMRQSSSCRHIFFSHLLHFHFSFLTLLSQVEMINLRIIQWRIFYVKL